jgi:hypothetical protein
MQAIANAGYSGKPLTAKLGLKAGMAAAFVALPESLRELASTAGLTTSDGYAQWRAVKGKEKYDFVHAFSKLRAEVEDGLARLQAAIKRDGTIWVSWPKKASKVATDLDENVVRAAALRLDLVDVKVAAIDEIWSGLKLVIRKDRR